MENELKLFRMKYEILEHTADLKIKSYGQDLPELFANSALAMTEFIFGEEVSEREAVETEIVEVEAGDVESLLVNWLSEILFLSATKYRAYIVYGIKEFTNKKIIAKVGLCEATAEEDIKAVTFNDLKIKQERDGAWSSIVVYDI